MCTPTGARLDNTLRLGALSIALLAATGCSTLRNTMAAYEVGPNGISRPQLRLREALAHQDFTVALAWKEEDELLRTLNTGVSTFYASQFARSAAVLDSAALLADDRITRSLSKEALSLVTSDLTRPYQARRTERLFIPYYGMLAFARLEQWEGAAVEARRLSALLQQYSEDRSDEEKGTHATLHYLAGVVFERAGERTDAQVAYRLARAIAPGMIDSVQARPAGSEGELVIVVERGFVAHRATESVNIFTGDSDRRRHRGRWNEHDYSYGDDHDDDDADNDDDRKRKDDGYWFSAALPSIRRSARPIGELSVTVDGQGVSATRTSALLDDAVSADQSRERATDVARVVARTAAKYAITKAVKDKKGEAAGKVVNIAASILERADIRSWHLLPQEISIVRVPLAAGQHSASVSVGGDSLDIGPLNVRAGSVTLTSVRSWQAPQRSYARR